MKRTITLAAATLMLAGAPAALAQTSSPWLHVRVEEAGKQSKVHVNLPMAIVNVALEAAPESVVSKGQFHLKEHGGDMSVADFRRIWNELKKSGDTDLVTVEENDEKVSVSKKGDKVLVNVDKPKDNEQVRVELPTSVVDAFFSAEGDSINLKAALAELSKLRGDVVKVTDKDSSVRIWIDEKNAQQ